MIGNTQFMTIYYLQVKKWRRLLFIAIAINRNVDFWIADVNIGDFFKKFNKRINIPKQSCT